MAGRRGRRPGGRGVSRTTVQRWARGGGRGTGDGGRGRKALWRPPGAGAAGAPVGACARGPLARAMIGCGPGAGGLGPPSSPPRVRPVPAHRVGRDPPRGGVHRRAAARAAARARLARPKIRRLDADPVLRERVVDPPGGPGPGTGRQTRSSQGAPRQRPDHPGGGAAAGSR